MVTGRTYSKNRYLIAFLITAAIFTLGLLLGSYLTTQREHDITQANQLQKLAFESLQLQSLYLTAQPNNKTCTGILTALDQSLTTLENTRAKLESYIAEAKLEDYDVLKHDYMLAEIRYWLFARKTQETCTNQNKVNILYFYSNTQGACDNCAAQGLILTNLKDTYKDQLLIFSIDGDYTNEPMINIVKQTYNITTYPTLIINDEPYPELQELEHLNERICTTLSSC